MKQLFFALLSFGVLETKAQSIGDMWNKTKDEVKKEPGHPVFCLRYVDKEFGIESCDNETLAALVATMKKLGSLDWNTTNVSDRHGCGYERIQFSSIRRPRPPHLTPDVDKLIAFRFHGKAPMLGYRNDNTFHICFLDPGFTLYDHG